MCRVTESAAVGGLVITTAALFSYRLVSSEVLCVVYSKPLCSMRNPPHSFTTCWELDSAVLGCRPDGVQNDLPNLSISVGGGKESNYDCLSNGERNGKLGVCPISAC